MAMKVYISVPMTGRTVKEVKSDIAATKKDFAFNKKSTKYISNLDIFESEMKKDEAERLDPLVCLGTALERIAECDAVLVANGWKESKGCQVEVATALLYNIPVYGLQTDSAEYVVRIQKKPVKR